MYSSPTVCPRCHSSIPAGAPACPACGYTSAPAAGYSPYQRPNMPPGNWQQPPQPYTQQTPFVGQTGYGSQAPNEGYAVASLVLGCLAIPAAFISCFDFGGAVVSILGVIFGAMGTKSPRKGMAIAGLILSGLGLLVNVAFIVWSMWPRD